VSFKDPWGCGACKMKFATLALFDEHRVGEYTNVHPHYGRSCLTSQDMKDRGYSRYEGVWTTYSEEEAEEIAKGRTEKGRRMGSRSYRSPP